MSFGIKLYPTAIAGAFSPRNGGVLTDSDSAPVQTGIGTEWVLLDVWDIAQDGPGVTADIAAPAVLTTGDLSYADSDPDTITRASGSWIDDGVRAGSQLVIVGGTNAGTYTVASATALIATLVASDTLIAGGQSYKIGDQEFTRADLRYLLQARKDAESSERATAKTIFQRVRFGSVR